MVNRLMISAIRVLVLMAMATFLHAGELKVEPDRTRLYEGEVLTLTVTGSMKLDINLSNLFNLDLSNLPSPDIEKVEPAFEVLAKNQRYSIRTVNNDMVGEITWTYQLAPQRSGKLTIPSLSFKDSTSKPVNIEVVSGNPPDQNVAASRDSFIELSADKAEIYVQEQLTMTIRLFFSGNLVRGELSEPEHPDAIIEPLGKQKEYSRYRDGVRYRVVERRYALFPQQPGELTLPPIRFEGQARDASGKLIFLRDSEQLYTVPVNDVPASYTGDTWLPASALTLDESGLPESLQVETGENLTRNITLRAAGLPAEALPPLPELAPEGLRSYPEAPERKTDITPAGLTSSLSQTRALVPVQSGPLTLPEIRITWWDTTSDSEQVAVIPAKTLQVGGASAQVNASTTPSGTDNDTGATTGTSEPRTSNNDTSNWQWLSLALAALWLATLVLWWRARNGGNTPKSQRAAPDHRESALFEQLIQAARKGSASTPALLVQWANQRFAGKNFRTASEVMAGLNNATLSAELRRLQARLFAPGNDTAEDWDGRALAKALQQVREQRNSVEPQGSELPPLYPDSLSA
ncbi:BatD family protein [Marinobacter alexandrii]|uniref:BatD family protein n=1 Tax=Marinobacter alexandrii TaxID=2570351 RepID=UPI001FFF06CC|nr:BatD family protein [Marinobacter alexandrii]MCK2149952.1 BatD family protein [Marinobacter alexandrii]